MSVTPSPFNFDKVQQYAQTLSMLRPQVHYSPLVPFKQHFPIDVFNIIVEMYVQDCLTDGDLGGLSRLMRASRLLHLWLGPKVYRFVSLSTFDNITSFSSSLQTAHRYTKAIHVSSEMPIVQTSSILRSVILRLEGRLERLCLPHNYVIPFSLYGVPVFVRDVTLLYNYSTIPGNLRCRRLRLALSYAEIEHEEGPSVNSLPFNSPLWIPLHHQVTSFAFELSGDDFDTISTLHEIWLNLKFTALHQCVAIIYFRSQIQLDQTRMHGKMLHFFPGWSFHVVYLLLEEHKCWTFEELERRGEDFWEKIQTRFE